MSYISSPTSQSIVIPKKSYDVSSNAIRHDYVIWLIVVCVVFFVAGIIMVVNTTIFSDLRVTGVNSSTLTRQEAHALFWANLIITIVIVLALFICIFLFFEIRQQVTLPTSKLTVKITQY